MPQITISSADIARCPKRDLAPSHWRPSALGEARCACQVRVKIDNTYSDGHESSHLVMLTLPGNDEWHSDDEEAWMKWWSEVVLPHTGDGHGAEVHGLGYCYRAEIIEGDHPLVGMTYEWSGR